MFFNFFSLNTTFVTRFHITLQPYKINIMWVYLTETVFTSLIPSLCLLNSIIFFKSPTNATNTHFVFVFINYYRNFDIIYLVAFELSFILWLKCFAATRTSSFASLSNFFLLFLLSFHFAVLSMCSWFIAIIVNCRCRLRPLTIKRFVRFILNRPDPWVRVYSFLLTVLFRSFLCLCVFVYVVFFHRSYYFFVFFLHKTNEKHFNGTTEQHKNKEMKEFVIFV